jgi:hypothetical protein
MEWVVNNSPSYYQFKDKLEFVEWEKAWDKPREVVVINNPSEAETTNQEDDNAPFEQVLLISDNNELDETKRIGTELEKLQSKGKPKNTTTLKFVSPHEVSDFYYGAFPWFFPYGQGGPEHTQRRAKKLSVAKWNQHIMEEFSQRFARSSLFIFTRYMEMVRSQAGVLVYRCSEKEAGKPDMNEELFNSVREFAQQGVNRNQEKKIESKLLKKISIYGGIMKGSGLEMKIEVVCAYRLPGIALSDVVCNFIERGSLHSRFV